MRLVQSRPNGLVLQARFFDIVAARLNVHDFRDIAQFMRVHCVRAIFDINRRIADR